MSAAEFKDAGNKALQAGNFDAAIEAYTKAIEINPNDHVFYSNRSAAYMKKEDYEKALDDGEKCISINPTWAKGYGRKGAALHALRQYEDALSTYEDGLAKCPGDESLINGMKEVEKVLDSRACNVGGGKGIFSPAMLQKLATHPKFGPKLSDPTFMMKLQMANSNPQLLMSDPELMEVLQAMIGGVGGDEDNYDSMSRPSAVPAPTPKAESRPPPPEPEVELTEEEKIQKARKVEALAAKERGNALYKAKSFDEAIAAYDEAIKLDPTNIMYINNKAAVFIEKGECDAAISLCNEALEIGKTNRASYDDKAKVYQRIAAAHLKLNDISAAIGAFQSSNMEKYDKAIERKIKNLELDLKKLERERYIDPILGAEAKERGNGFFREGKFAEAINEYEDAIKRDPTNAAYHNNLAATYQKMGLFNDAMKEVEKAIELDRNYVKAWAKKGDLEFFAKQYHKALDSYRAGLQIEPENPTCKQGYQKVMMEINMQASGGAGPDKERAARAMQDPEIQQILSDPTIKQVLNDFQENPKYAQQAMRDPGIASKIERLIQAGVLSVK